MSRELQVTLDCADPDALMRFWCQALGYVPDPPPPGFDTWDAALDALGGRRLRRFEPDPPLSHGFVVMADPEGNELCLD